MFIWILYHRKYFLSSWAQKAALFLLFHTFSTLQCTDYAMWKDIWLYSVLWCFFGRMSRERESVNAPTLVPSPHSYPLSFLTVTFIRNAPFPVTETSTASFPDRITSPQNELSVSEEENCFITSGTFPRLIERTAQHEAASFSGAQENTSSYLPEAGQIHLRTLCISRAEEQDSLSIYTSASLGWFQRLFSGFHTISRIFPAFVL